MNYLLSSYSIFITTTYCKNENTQLIKVENDRCWIKASPLDIKNFTTLTYLAA